jgi:hypothetical protein
MDAATQTSTLEPIKPKDHMYVLAQPEDKPLIQFMFGRPEAE